MLCSAAGELPIVQCREASARVIMGRLWGAAAPTTTHAETIYADILLEPGGSVPIRLAYSAALVGTSAYIIGVIASRWLPDPKTEALPD